MRYKVVFTDSALSDIKDAALYISDVLKNNEAANRLLDLIRQKMEALAETPYATPLVKDSVLAANGIRFQLIKNYMIVSMRKPKSFRFSVFSIQGGFGFLCLKMRNSKVYFKIKSPLNFK